MNRPDSTTPNQQPRRGFLQFITAVVSGALALVPAAIGVRVFLDPLRKTAATSDFTKVTSLTNVPDDGVPRQFPVIADQKDAWTFTPNQRIGAVFLRRQPGEETPQCFTSTCPHAGCMVSYASQTKTYDCPCHDSKFTIDGGRIDPTPSARDMDSLEVKVNENSDVLVRFERFYTGRHDRKEMS